MNPFSHLMQANVASQPTISTGAESASTIEHKKPPQMPLGMSESMTSFGAPRDSSKSKRRRSSSRSKRSRSKSKQTSPDERGSEERKHKRKRSSSKQSSRKQPSSKSKHKEEDQSEVYGSHLVDTVNDRDLDQTKVGYGL